MQISAFRQHTVEALRDFTWDQVAQLGVFSTNHNQNHGFIDPEACLLLAFEVGRYDPRLFDEVLDWLACNKSIISIQRLRNLSTNLADRQLTDAALAWTNTQEPDIKNIPLKNFDNPPQQLFYTTKTTLRKYDSTYYQHGLLRPPIHRSSKSEKPDLSLPANLGFRLRNLLGISVRAEIIRILLSAHKQAFSTQQIAHFTAYSKRNTQEALTALENANVIRSKPGVTPGRLYTINDTQWTQFLGYRKNQLPPFQPWPQIFSVLRQTIRWLKAKETQNLSQYMESSQAQTFLDTIATELTIIEFSLEIQKGHERDGWKRLVQITNMLLGRLSS